jgi:hypothetical protein
LAAEFARRGAAPVPRSIKCANRRVVLIKFLWRRELGGSFGEEAGRLPAALPPGVALTKN